MAVAICISLNRRQLTFWSAILITAIKWIVALRTITEIFLLFTDFSLLLWRMPWSEKGLWLLWVKKRETIVDYFLFLLADQIHVMPSIHRLRNYYLKSKFSATSSNLFRIVPVNNGHVPLIINCLLYGLSSKFFHYL